MAKVRSDKVEEPAADFARREAMSDGDLDWEGLPTGWKHSSVVESIDTVVPEWDEAYLKRVQQAMIGAGAEPIRVALKGLGEPIGVQMMESKAAVDALVALLDDAITKYGPHDVDRRSEDDPEMPDDRGSVGDPTDQG